MSKVSINAIEPNWKIVPLDLSDTQDSVSISVVDRVKLPVSNYKRERFITVDSSITTDRVTFRDSNVRRERISEDISLTKIE